MHHVKKMVTDSQSVKAPMVRTHSVDDRQCEEGLISTNRMGRPNSDIDPEESEKKMISRYNSFVRRPRR